jgi:hypothetical protein
MSAMIRPRTAMIPPVFLALALAAPSVAQAQTMAYGDVSGGEAVSGGPGADAAGSDDSQLETFSPKKARRAGRDGRGGGKRVVITPYIEANQIVDAELSPGSDVVTYSQAAAGLDATVAGRNNAASVSVRYEYHYGWGKKAGNGDSISGIASGYTTIAPGLTLQAGALATHASERGGGAGLGGNFSRDDATVDVYAIQGGPSLVTRAGDLDVSANYRAGFTKIDTHQRVRAGSTVIAPDVFDKSVSQIADVEAGFAPGTVLPVGVGAAGSFYQEDVNNLDQRVRDMQARGIVTVPVGRTVQATGAIGYEDVEVSSRDAVRDASGNPVVGRNGRYVTDKGSPRRIAYDTEGLIWDVGVMWRPSPRTALTAHVGRRYGAMNYNGTFTWSPDNRRTVSLAVYDTISAFGGNLSRLLDNLPDDFVAVRNPVTGNVGGCVASLEGNNCLAGALGAIRSSTFRSRGIAASYSMRFGRLDAGVGLGYDNRKYIAAPGTVLAIADGLTDENYWLTAYLSGQIDPRSGWGLNAYASLVKSDLDLGNVTNVGASAAYYRNLTRHLRAHAALSIDGTMASDDLLLDDFWNASALVGMRYSF